MATTLKHSKQREALITMLRNRYDHPTAEQLYNDLKSKFPRISLGTVYRNLSLLESLGEVVKISANGTSERYDGNMGEHYHFACEKCSGIEDLDIPVMNELTAQVEKTTRGDVTRHSMVFYGICEKCKRKHLTNEIVVL